LWGRTAYILAELVAANTESITALRVRLDGR
jgi:hypothetical protein